MHQARPAERDHLGLLIAHARKRGGPLASAPQSIDLSAGIDHAAVHQPRHDRKQLAGDDGEHRLVQALETGDDVALIDERAALHVARRRHQVRVSKRLSDCDGLACGCRRRIGVSLAQLLFGDRNGQVASLRTVVIFDEPLASRRPGVRLTGLSTRQEGEREPERAARRARMVARLVMDTVLALEDSQKLGLAAAQARGCRQPFEIVGLEGRRLIRTLQRVVRLTPRATSVAFTAVFKIIHLNHARAEPYAGPSS